ncbi:MAG: thioredoxin domain-containing protein [Patescibacteria group bacterium]|jgi:protein-disulfide isomerase
MGKKLFKFILLFLLFLILAFAIAFGLYTFKIYRETRAELSGKIRLSGEKHTVDIAGNYWLGAPDPKVTIIEFGDFACPNCKNSFPVIRELITTYKNDVKLVYKDYPQFEESLDLAEGARCAGEQGRMLFWLMHDKLFLNQGVNTAEGIFEAAKQIGVDESRFKKCFEENKYREDIKKDVLDAQAIGLSGTPAWIINGYMVKGDIPLDIWDKLIKQLINDSI